MSATPVKSGAGYQERSTNSLAMLLPLAAVIFLAGGQGPNVLLALFSVVALVLGGVLLWRPSETPILGFVFVWQWLQASISTFYANWLGVDVAAMSWHGGDQKNAIILSLVGLLAMALGMRLGAGPGSAQLGYVARQIVQSQPAHLWFWLYIKAYAIALLLSTFAWIVPGLMQVVLAIAALKWAFFLMLAYAVLITPLGHRYYIVIAFFLEFFLGLGGYFSDFKTVFLFIFIAMFTAAPRFSKGRLLATILAGVFLIGLGTVWSSVKTEYRAFVSGGSDEQTIAVDYPTASLKFWELVSELDSSDLEYGFDSMMRRFSYVEAFGVVLRYVPVLVPHANGAILWDAISRPFRPRLLDPEKTAIDDTARTNLYTGGIVKDPTKTSVSLGHIAEAYIDFGTYGMMLSLMAIGWFYGRVYHFFVNWSKCGPLWGMAVATSILFGTARLDGSITKIMGGIIVSIVAAWLITIYGLPALCPWVRLGFERRLQPSPSLQ